MTYFPKNSLENHGICDFPYGVYDNVAQLAKEINKLSIVDDNQHLVPTEFHINYYVWNGPAVA